MREIKMEENFNFGREDDRERLLTYNDFIYGHYSIGTGSLSICGAAVDGKLYYGVALCSPLDNFHRKLGRYKAEDHLVLSDKAHMRGVFTLTEDVDKISPGEILKKAAQHHISKMRRLPKWAKGRVVKFRGE